MIESVVREVKFEKVSFRLLNSEIGNDLDTYYEFDTDEFVFSSP